MNNTAQYSAELFPWGKFESTSKFHRLEHHCADVAACFECLLQGAVFRRRFERAMGAELCAVTESRLVVLAFLHDLGKLNAGFQFKVIERRLLPPGAPPKSGHLLEAHWCFQQERICEALGLDTMDRTWGAGFVSLLCASLAHHGRPTPAPKSGEGPPSLWRPFAGYDPCVAAAFIGDRIRTWFPDAFADGPSLPDAAPLAHLFAGTVALADQIGSDEAYFRYEPKPDSTYLVRARELATQAVQARKLLRAQWSARATRAEFRDLFGHPSPRPLQSAVAEAPLDHPLLVLEAETGSGKTEAAVLRFAALWRAGLVDGLYFALPTRAAASQLQRRVHHALQRLFPPDEHVETVLAVPGYFVAGEAAGRATGKFQVYWEDEPDEETRQARWSAESTRHFLSAPAAVGTIDQALLAGLRTKWAHLRGSALARNLLVVDEAHASDAYMTELLRAVLHGHLAVGGHALLMSATLGAAARVRLTEPLPRVEVPTREEMEAVPYPALTLAGAGASQTRELAGTGLTRAVSVMELPRMGDAIQVASLAQAAARQGAKALVIRNTVKQAQAVFRALGESGGAEHALQVAGGPALHHSRFAAEDRRLLDRAVERALGNGRQPGGVVVIGTQTLEQSLDIDADLLLTDLCPVDVLLQRIGRLHRHPDTVRPERHRVARCVVLTPEEGLEAGLDGGLLRYGLGASRDGGGVYRDLLVLEATRRLVVEHPVWDIPSINRMLVERATHPHQLRVLAHALGAAWLESEQRSFGFAACERQMARGHLLDRNTGFDADLSFPDLDEKVRTRLGEDGPRVVLAAPVRGPFGTPVRTFNLPAALFRGTGGLPSKEEIDAAWAEAVPEGLLLHVGAYVFVYGRMGVDK